MDLPLVVHDNPEGLADARSEGLDRQQWVSDSWGAEGLLGFRRPATGGNMLDRWYILPQRTTERNDH